ncbi:MAG: putative bifunctional diguanylate cyclase/phosphodiesterase, partial [Mariprofundaceae bacterium]
SFFLLVILLLSRRFNITLCESLQLRFENIALVDSLKTEIDQRKQTEKTVRGHNTVLQKLAGGEALSEVLNNINDMIEAQLSDAISSILMLDESGRYIHTASAPRLPKAYSTAIDGKPIGPKAGSCGTAAWRNEMVVVENIATDPLWKDYRDLALAHDLKACWSMPVRNSRGKVIGTFALYYREPKSPDKSEIELIKSAAHLTGITIEHKQAADRMESLAHTDQLTKLPNRALFMDRLSQALAQARRRKQQLALLFVDLDKFKLINDTLGHEAGDRTLEEVASRILACVREMDTVARLGGDEFTVILMDIKHAGDAATVARKIQSALSLPVELEGNQYNLGSSIGISLFPKDGTDVDTLLKNADATMYRAKESGGSAFQFYTRSLGDQVSRQLDMEKNLRKAVKQGEFELHYQLKIELKTGRVSGTEALLRWQHPQNGLTMPDKFLPLAEKTGLILPIGEWVLEHSCAQRKAWQDEDEKVADSVPIAINVTMNISALQLNNGDLVTTIGKVLKKTGLPASCLELEISESGIMEQADEHMDILQQLKELGVRLTIDNFGTGFSSLGYLEHFPIDSLKIDRSIIRHLPDDQNSVTLTTTIINLAHNLGIKVIAEGVETSGQLKFLRTHDCDEAQGFLLHRPAPGEKVTKLFKGKAWQKKWQALLNDLTAETRKGSKS